MADQPSNTPLGPADFRSMTDCAVLVIDMWDDHWCTAIATRVAELAPRLNAFLIEARKRGALILHAPSGTMGKYYDNPGTSKTEPERLARQRTLAARTPNTLPASYQPPPDRVVPPVDDWDGGCEAQQRRHPPGTPVWKKEIATIIIEGQDAIADDNLAEVYNVLKKENRTRLLLTGVALNECVLHTRTFSINKLVALQATLQQLANEPYRLEQIVLVRDLTDSAYNPQMPPHINHFAGTDVVVKYIEHTFPPVSLMDSSWLLGGQPFHFAADTRYPRPDTPLQPRSGTYKLKCWRSLGMIPPGEPLRLEPPGAPRWLTVHGTDLLLVHNEAAAPPWRVEEFAPNLFTFSLEHLPQYLLGADPNTGHVQLQSATKDSTAAKNWWYWEGPVVVPTLAKVGDEEVVMPVVQFPMNPRLIWCDMNGLKKFRYLVGDPKTDTLRLVSVENAAKDAPGWSQSAV